MKKKITIGAVTLIFAVLLTGTVLIAGAADSDPLVTLSYINETVIPKITEDVKNAVLAVLDEREAQPETPEQTDPTEQPETPMVTEVDLSSVKYNVIYLSQGQKLFATGTNTESTEIILRAGEASCISPFGDQGIADLTASKELYNGEPLVKNNYCLIPRGSDGRGICAVSSDVYILVRGEYEIVQE